MKRKLVKHGAVTLMVSLPAKWIKAQGLVDKDEVIVRERGDEILIRSQTKSSSISIDVKSNDEHHISWLIRDAYLKGYTEMVLNFSKTPRLQQLNTIVNFFTGLEIVENHGNKIKIKNFVQDDNSQFDNLVVKLFQIVKVMIDEVKREWDQIDIKNFYSTRMMSYRLRDHCLRMSRSMEDNFEYYSFLWELQNVANKVYYMAGYISKHNIKKSKLINSLDKIFNKIYEAYLKRDINTSYNNLKSYHEELKKLSSANIRKLFDKEDSVLAFHYSAIMVDLSIICNRIIYLSK